jgi:hypothetical protein
MRDHPVSQIEHLESRRLLSIVPAGGEFPVNAHTTNQQVSARVTVGFDGSSIVVWTSVNQAGPGSGQDVYARRFDASGLPLGSEFLVNQFTSANQLLPAIAISDGAQFVVVWAGPTPGGVGNEIHARRFDAAGQALGDEFRVNTYSGGDESFPAVAMDADGDFVVTWDTFNPSVGDGYDVYARRFNSAGVPQGDDFLVNTDLPNHDYTSSVTMDDAGNFVVAWHAEFQDGSGHGVYARQFDSNGEGLGNEFRVNTFTTNNQLFPSVAIDADGDFVVAWQSQAQDGSGTGIFAQRFSSSGAPAGPEFIVNTYTSDGQDAPSVAMDAAGNVIIVWESFGPDQSLLGVRARAFRASGTALGAEFGVNTHVISDQAFASASLSATGDAVVAWQSFGQDGDQNGIYAQRYRFDELAPTVTASAFHYETLPHQLRLTFSENVAGSLSEADLTVIDLGGGPPIATTLTSYDPLTNTATFAFADTLPDGRFRATLAATGVTDAAGNPLAADHVFDFFFLRGDANHDARVNLTDFNILAANFGESNRDFTQGDFNYDGVVNLTDFNLLAARFGVVLSPARGRGEENALEQLLR